MQKGKIISEKNILEAVKILQEGISYDSDVEKEREFRILQNKIEDIFFDDGFKIRVVKVNYRSKLNRVIKNDY